MDEALSRYAIPAMIAVAFGNFIWAFVLTAVKPPAGAEEKDLPPPVNQAWKDLDAGPQGIRIMMPQKARRKTKKV